MRTQATCDRTARDILEEANRSYQSQAAIPDELDLHAQELGGFLKSEVLYNMGMVQILESLTLEL